MKKVEVIAFFFASFFVPYSAFAFTIDATGGDCSAVGAWDALTETCTLTGDLSATIIIATDNITIDGNGHAITGTATTTGITALLRQNIVIKNLTLSGFSKAVSFGATKNSKIENNTFIGNATGIAANAGTVYGPLSGNIYRNNVFANNRIAISLFATQGDIVERNTITSALSNDTGIVLSANNSIPNIVRNNIIEGPGLRGISGGDSDSDEFTRNTIRNFKTGLQFSSCSMGHSFTENTIEGNTLGASFAGSSGTFWRNNFKNNARDIQNGRASCGNGIEILSKPLPDGGNYWSNNIACADTNHDNICDNASAAATSTDNSTSLTTTLFDNFPWTAENGWNLPTTTPITLSNPTETEDDNNQDTKGVADKTVFTFGVTASGTPDTVNLVAVSENGTTTLPLLHRVVLGEYSATPTFPQGHYSYHFEANNGAQRFPASGELEFTTGYSNVAFLHGLEASRLYTQGTLFENQLWEPNRNDDVRKLYLNPDGTSVNFGIYTRDEIDEIYSGFSNIYKTFAESMRRLVDEKIINEFEALPYDWRLSLDDVLASGKKNGDNISYTQATSSPFIIQEVERLAQNSDTGKVTIIAHSNGGLLAKRLTKKLEEKGKGNITDKIILVAVPQTGTPQAIAALLHGYDQDLGGGFVLNKPNARTFAENMPGGYNLLPYGKYFTDVSTPVVTFNATSTATKTFRDFYGTDISNSFELTQFLNGAEGRAKPSPNDTDNPNILNFNLLQNSFSVRDFLDRWTPPAGVEVVQIAGWGVTKTLGGINYTEKDNPACVGFTNCAPKKILDLVPNTVIDGDGTVVVPSALALGTAVASYYVNLNEYNNIFHINRNHSDIMEVTHLQEFLQNLIQNKNTLTRNISRTLPISSPTDTRLTFAVHSPVSLNLYDAQGRHTGISTTTIPNSDIELIDEQIPNSYYLEFGEGKYAGADTISTTTVHLAGLALGTFTFDIEEKVGNIVIASTTFANVPTATSSVFTLDTQNLSQPPTLLADIDGDGTVDTTISAGDGVSPQELIAVLKGVVKTLDLPTKKKDALLKKIDKLEKAIEKEYKNEKNKKRKTTKAFEDIQEKIMKFEKKGILTHDETTELFKIIEQIKASVVK